MTTTTKPPNPGTKADLQLRYRALQGRYSEALDTIRDQQARHEAQGNLLKAATQHNNSLLVRLINEWHETLDERLGFFERAPLWRRLYIAFRNTL